MANAIDHKEVFQSTHPVRGGTDALRFHFFAVLISIHPPREGWDAGEVINYDAVPEFQSTHPVRGGT